MLKTPDKGIGKFAVAALNHELYGVGKPNVMQAGRLLLYSFALSKSQYLTPVQIKDITKKLTDIEL